MPGKDGSKRSHKILGKLSGLYRLGPVFLAQGIWSLSSFVVTFYLARSLSIEIFGLYGLIVAARLLILAVSGAFFVTPMTVIISQAGKQADDKLQLVVDLVKVFLLLVFFVVILIGKVWDGWQMAFALGLFFCGGLALDVGRRIDYLQSLWFKDFVGSISVFVMTMGGLWWLKSSYLLSLPASISIIGVSQLIWIGFSSKRTWFRRKSSGHRNMIKELWKRAQWGLASAGASYGYMQASTFIVFMVVGSAGVALLEISRQLMIPVQIFMSGMANAFHPHISRQCSSEPRNLLFVVFRITVLQLGAGLFLVVAITLLAGPMLQLFVGEKFTNYEEAIPFVKIWGAIMLAQIGWQHASFCLYSLSAFKLFFLNRLVPLIVVLPITWWATELWFEEGALWARFFAEVMVICGGWYYLYKKTLVSS